MKDLKHFQLDLKNLEKSVSSLPLEKHLSQLSSHEKALKEKFTSKKIGFYDWPYDCTQDDVNAIREHAEQVRKDFEGVVLIGIGGSYLGAVALLDALRDPGDANNFPFAWISNADAPAMEKAIRLIKRKRCRTVLISKSGGTTETLSAFFHLSGILEKNSITVITDPTSGELRKLSQTHGWKAFPVPPNIGGRFSVLTAVGLLPLALGDVDILGLLQGAREMRNLLEDFPAKENPAYLYALYSYLSDVSLKKNIHYLMPYQSNLKLIGDWFVQLFGESLGKKTLSHAKSVGFSPVAALGTTDQHSLLQLFKEGPDDKIVGFINVLPKAGDLLVGKSRYESPDFDFLTRHSFAEINHKACLATEQSLQSAGRTTYRISFREISAKSLGALLFFFETACAMAGELYEVDAFNQPGVEEAKKLLRQSL